MNAAKFFFEASSSYLVRKTLYDYSRKKPIRFRSNIYYLHCGFKMLELCNRLNVDLQCLNKKVSETSGLDQTLIINYLTFGFKIRA